MAFQHADLTLYGLTTEQCSRSVYAISEKKTYSGAAAIALLLEKRGNGFASGILRLSGPLGRGGYRWIANHRNSPVVQTIKWFLDRSNRKVQAIEG